MISLPRTTQKTLADKHPPTIISHCETCTCNFSKARSAGVGSSKGTATPDMTPYTRPIIKKMPPAKKTDQQKSCHVECVLFFSCTLCVFKNISYLFFHGLQHEINAAKNQGSACLRHKGRHDNTNRILPLTSGLSKMQFTVFCTPPIEF